MNSKGLPHERDGSAGCAAHGREDQQWWTPRSTANDSATLKFRPSRHRQSKVKGIPTRDVKGQRDDKKDGGAEKIKGMLRKDGGAEKIKDMLRKEGRRKDQGHAEKGGTQKRSRACWERRDAEKIKGMLRKEGHRKDQGHA
jgi:hypothetical protein